MPVSVFHSYTMTTPDDPAWEWRPSHNNAPHAVTLSLQGSEVSGAFSNAGNVSFGLSANGYITASANVTAAPSPVNVTGANGSSANAQTIAFSNSNGMTLGVSTAANGATITGSYTVPSVPTAYVSSVNGSSGAISLNAGSSLSASTNGSSITFGLASNITTALQSAGAYLTTAAQSNQVVNSLNGSTGQISLNVGSSLSSSTNGSSITFGLASNITTALQSAGAYLTTARASNDAVGLNTAVSNATATINSSGFSLDARGYAGTGTSATNASITLNSNGLAISVAAPGGGGGVALYDGANSISTGTARFSNANGVSFGFNGQTITASVAAAGGAQTGISGIQVSNTTYTVGTVTFQNANGISFGSSGANGISASYTVPTLTSWTVSDNATSATVGRLAFTQANGITMSLSTSNNGNHTVFASHNGLTSQSNQALSAANGSFAFQTANFSNANGVSFITSAGSAIAASVETSYAASNHSHGNPTLALTNLTGTTASASNGFTLSLSAAAAGAAAANVNLVGANTAGNTTASGSTLGFSGLNLTLSGTNASNIVFSAPATSSLSGTGQVSISVNGSTISIGVPNPTTESGYNPYADLLYTTAAFPQGSFLIDPEAFPNVQFDRVGFPVSHSNATNSSGSYTLSYLFGLYSRNASTLSLVHSASSAIAITGSGTQGIYSSIGGMRVLTLGMTTTIPSGKYWMGFGFRSSSAGANATFNNFILSAQTDGFGGFFSAATAATNQYTLGQGFYSATTAGVPASIAFSQINGTNANAQRQHVIMFYSSTV